MQLRTQYVLISTYIFTSCRRYPFRVPAYYALILRSLTVLEGLALQADAKWVCLSGACGVHRTSLLAVVCAALSSAVSLSGRTHSRQSAHLTHVSLRDVGYFRLSSHVAPCAQLRCACACSLCTVMRCHVQPQQPPLTAAIHCHPCFTCITPSCYNSIECYRSPVLSASACSYKLLGRAYPYVARRLLTDPAPELRECFEDLILKDGAFRCGLGLRTVIPVCDYVNCVVVLLCCWSRLSTCCG